MPRKIVFFVTALMIVTLFISCDRNIGSGVILWSTDEDLISSGTVIKIYEESRIRHTYTISEIGSKDKFEMETWRIDFFDKEQDARESAERYTPYITSFAFSERQGLPVRELETSDSERVYKLREGQEIKVIGRADAPVEIGRFTGYWYNILTDDGVTGFVYDAFLTVFSMNEKERIIENARDTSDPLLDIFLDSTWRPSYYNDMITKDIIDLTSFKDSYALKVDRDKKEISLRLSNNKNITETYREITRFGSKRYDFEGTSFRVTMVSETVASVLYKFEGKDINEAFVVLHDNVNEIVSAELTRRENLLEEFMEKGSVFTSANYGSINIIDDTGRFIWNDIGQLISEKIISSDSEPQGRISFSHFPDTLIKNIYSGVITFDFRNGSFVNFLYSFTDTGVSFIYVPDRYISNLIVTTDQFFDPKQIYFKFDKETAMVEDKEEEV